MTDDLHIVDAATLLWNNYPTKELPTKGALYGNRQFLLNQQNGFRGDNVGEGEHREVILMTNCNCPASKYSQISQVIICTNFLQSTIKKT